MMKVVLGVKYIFCAVMASTFLVPLSAISKPNNVGKVYVFGIVPQQSPLKTIRTWGPLLAYLTKKTGIRLLLRTNKSIPEFQHHLKQQVYDFSYMNPYHYTVFHDSSNYNSIAKAKGKRIKGILVVRKDSHIKSLKQLDDKDLAFPSPAAFAASMLPRAYLKKEKIKIKPNYVKSHDAVYRNVAFSRFVAGGGVVRTYKSVDKKIRSQLRVLWITDGYTPHAIAANKRVPKDVVARIQKALMELHLSKEGKSILTMLKLKGFIDGKDSDWDDVRALSMHELK